MADRPPPNIFQATAGHPLVYELTTAFGLGLDAQEPRVPPAMPSKLGEAESQGVTWYSQWFFQSSCRFNFYTSTWPVTIMPNTQREPPPATPCLGPADPWQLLRKGYSKYWN